MEKLFTVRQLAVGGFDRNFSYLVYAAGGDAVLVDPTGDGAVIRRAVREAGALTPRAILLTHGHRDHTEQVTAAADYFPAPVLAHPECGRPDAGALRDGEKLPLGTGWIEVLYTPGHSPDSVCYRLGDDRGLFTGDTLFVGCCGYCDPEVMERTLRERIRPLAGSLAVYSGHDYGDRPFSLLAEERRSNPYLNAASLEEFRRLAAEL